MLNLFRPFAFSENGDIAEPRWWTASGATAAMLFSASTSSAVMRDECRPISPPTLDDGAGGDGFGRRRRLPFAMLSFRLMLRSLRFFRDVRTCSRRFVMFSTLVWNPPEPVHTRTKSLFFRARQVTTLDLALTDAFLGASLMRAISPTEWPAYRATKLPWALSYTWISPLVIMKKASSLAWTTRPSSIRCSPALNSRGCK